MVRPLKSGLDYFPLDVDIDQDDKTAIIEALHGIEGFGILIKLLMKIYKEGYFYEWTRREQLLFSKRVNVDINHVNEVVNDCIKEGLFHEQLFNDYSILTSKGIQKRYLEAIKRRKEVRFQREYFLITDIESVLGTSNLAVLVVDADGNEVNVNINSNNDSKSTQRKEKKRKGKNTISLKFETCDMESAQYFFSLIKTNNPGAKEPNLEKWADDIRKIREIDNKPTKHINALMKWAQEDSFWSGNILSPDKLRKKWDQLVIKAKKEREEKEKKLVNFPQRAQNEGIKYNTLNLEDL